MKKHHVKLTEPDRQYLEMLIGKGQHSAKLYKRAVALLALDRGETYVHVAEIVGVTHQVVSTWAKNYRETGLRCLEDKPCSGRPIEIDGLARAKITALACSDPPEGYHRQLRQVTKTKAAFPNPEAARKLLYLVTQNIQRTWSMPVFNWPSILNQLAIRFDGRLPVD